MSSGPGKFKFGFDPDALRARYHAERDRRLRSDGNQQYLEMAGQLADFAADPHAPPWFTREAVTEDVQVLVVGGGLSGLIVAARLRMAGTVDIRIIDKAGDFGGTWYWNRYPGVACDVESYMYLPLLEELGYIPREKYSKGEEIFAHCKAIGRHFDLYKDAYFQTRVIDVRWREEIARWEIDTDRGDAITARFVCLSSGPQSLAKLPGIPGIKAFKGRSFHTSRWDFAYTGGNSQGNLTGLRDKRVAVIGTGASAVQCIPHLGEWAQRLYVIQRTPASVDVRGNRPTDPGWAATLVAGWQARRRENFEAIVAGQPQPEDLVADSWTEMCRALAQDGVAGDDLTADFETRLQLADFRKMEAVRQRVEALVHDPDTAESLKPYYNQFCKRPCFHDEYLQTFNRPNVTLIDNKGKGVERITETAVIVGGQSFEVDCLIYSTGFDVAVPPYRAGGFGLWGRNGVSLASKWHRGIKSMHGIYTSGFPNLFILGGIHHAAATVNFTYMIDEQGKHVAALIKRCLDEKIRIADLSEEAEEAWAQTIKSKSIFREKFFKECTPSYINKEGEIEGSLYSTVFGGGPIEYIQLLKAMRYSPLQQVMNIVHG